MMVFYLQPIDLSKNGQEKVWGHIDFHVHCFLFTKRWIVMPICNLNKNIQGQSGQHLWPRYLQIWLSGTFNSDRQNHVFDKKTRNHIRDEFNKQTDLNFQ